MEWILILYFPGFPEESLEPQSPSANTTLISKNISVKKSGFAIDYWYRLIFKE